MKLEIKLSRQTLSDLLFEFTPIRIHLTKTDEDLRWVELERPESIEMVPGRGLRFSTHGRLRYTLAGVGVPLKIRRIVLLLEPKVLRAAGDPLSLAFELHIEEADLELVPGLIDHVLAARINDVLCAEKTPLSWVFGKTLTRSVALPERIEPLSRLDLTSRDAVVSSDEQGLSFTIDVTAHLARTKARPDDNQRIEHRNAH